MLSTILSGIDTDVTTVDDGGGELLAVGALRIALGSGRAVEPYVIVGGGVARALGDAGPSLNLRADLRFVTSGVQQLQQIDAVTVTTLPQLGGVFLTGGGLRKAVGGRSAIRLDARVHWIGDTTATRVQTAPEDIDGPSAVLFLRASTVSITFSGFAPAARSSLSVPLENFETFTASGMRTQFSLTFGYDIRF